MTYIKKFKSHIIESAEPVYNTQLVKNIYSILIDLHKKDNVKDFVFSTFVEEDSLDKDGSSIAFTFDDVDYEIQNWNGNLVLFKFGYRSGIGDKGSELNKQDLREMLLKFMELNK